MHHLLTSKQQNPAESRENLCNFMAISQTLTHILQLLFMIKLFQLELRENIFHYICIYLWEILKIVQIYPDGLDFATRIISETQNYSQRRPL